MNIKTDLLSLHHKELVESLCQQIINENPNINALCLSGSHWNKQTQIPNYDIDINYFGTIKKESDIINSTTARFLISSVKIEISCFSKNNNEDEFLKYSLAKNIAVLKVNILWEKNEIFTTLKNKILLKVKEPNWCYNKLIDEFNLIKSWINWWKNENTIIENQKKDNDFFHSVIANLLAIISPIIFRPPSVARKGLFEIKNILDILQCTVEKKALYSCLGITHISKSDILTFFNKLKETYRKVNSINKEYYLAGISHFISNNNEQEAIWPIWRGFKECNEIQTSLDGFEQLKKDLHFNSVESVLKKVYEFEKIILSLENKIDCFAEIFYSNLKRSNDFF